MLDLHECLAWPHPHWLESASFSLSLIYYTLFLSSLFFTFHVFCPTGQNVLTWLLSCGQSVQLCTFVRTVLLLFGLRANNGTYKHAWRCGPHEVKRHWLHLLSIYQHNAAYWDKWQHYCCSEWGLLGPGLSAFHSPCGVLCYYGRWHPAAGLALITHGWESVTALCRVLWSAASMQSSGYNVLFMGNNQDLTSERVLKWYLWCGINSAWKGFWKHFNKEKKLRKLHTQKIKLVTFLSCRN